MRSSDLKWVTGFCKFCTFTRFAADLSWSLGVWSAKGVIGLDRGVLRSTTFAELNQHGWDVAIWNPTYVWDQQKAEKCVTLCDWFILLGRTCSVLWSSQSWTKGWRNYREMQTEDTAKLVCSEMLNAHGSSLLCRTWYGHVWPSMAWSTVKMTMK